MQNPRIQVRADGTEWLVMDGKEARIWRDFFVYGFPAVTDLAAGGQITVNLNIQSDSDFEWIYGAYQYSRAEAAFTESSRPIPNSRVLLIDAGSGRQLSNQAVPIENLFGIPWQPYELPISKVFKANTTISAQVTNFDAAVADGNLQLQLVGYKIFYY